MAEKGTAYCISEEFARIVRDYAEEHILPEATEKTGEEEPGVEKMSQEEPTACELSLLKL